MISPVRLRLSRAKGFDLQAHSRALNGLPITAIVGGSADRIKRLAEENAELLEVLRMLDERGHTEATWARAKQAMAKATARGQADG